MIQNILTLTIIFLYIGQTLHTKHQRWDTNYRISLNGIPPKMMMIMMMTKTRAVVLLPIQVIQNWFALSQRRIFVGMQRESVLHKWVRVPSVKHVKPWIHHLSVFKCISCYRKLYGFVSKLRLASAIWLTLDTLPFLWEFGLG